MLNYCANGPSGYNLTNSLRFRSSASAYLSRTPASNGDRQKWTFSCWVKRGASGVRQGIFTAQTNAGIYWGLEFETGNNLNIYDSNAGGTTALTTTALYRDFGAWYHVVVAVDTTQATASNRCKIYVNGNQVTSFVTADYPTQNSNTQINTASVAHRIGNWVTSNLPLDGYLTEVNFIDGQALTPSSFGSTNSTTGVWQPAKYTGTYGTNGFYLPFSTGTTSTYQGNFSGSNYLTTANNSTGDLTGNFTIECWHYGATPAGYAGLIAYTNTGTGWSGWQFVRNVGAIVFNGLNASGVQDTLSVGSLTANQWNHVAVVRNGSTITMYLNGVSQGTITSSYSYVGSSSNYKIGTDRLTTSNWNGAISNARVVVGTAIYTANFTPPTSPLTAVSGTQLLVCQNATFVDNSTNAFTLTNTGSVTSTVSYPFEYIGLGKDSSGNNNNWTTNNISSIPGTTYDSMTDVPTLTSATVANYAVMNPLVRLYGTATLSDANLKINDTSTGGGAGYATIAVTSGKFYYEFTPSAVGKLCGMGVTFASTYTFGYDGCYLSNGTVSNTTGGTATTYASYTTNDIIGVAFDADAGKVWFYKNGTLQAGDPVAGTSPAFTWAVNSLVTATYAMDNSAGTVGINANFGQRPFTYTPPTGYVALNTYNLPTSTIVQGNKYMDATTYTGTGATQSITNGGFYPDFTWIKSRSNATNNDLFTAVLSGDNYLKSNSTDGVVATTNAITSFNSNGFTLGSDSNSIGVNINTNTYVAWQWLANGNSGTTINTNGSITSYINANTSSGFSQVYWTGTAANGTLGHGLGVAPKFIITKCRGASTDWAVYHASLTSASYYLLLNSTAAQTSNATYWNSTAPTSSVFSVGSSNPTNAATAMVAFCWAEIAGFSKFGSYTGNGSTDGPFVYLGFRPKFIMYKKTTTGTGNSHWWIFDSSRNLYNLTNSGLNPDGTYAENSTLPFTDFLSNGFKLRTDNGENNDNGQPYIYAAFAENPFKNALAR